MYERRDNAGGPFGDGPAPRASVALTSMQWAALVYTAELGVRALVTAKNVPLAFVSEMTTQVSEASQEIQRRMDAETKERGG